MLFIYRIVSIGVVLPSASYIFLMAMAYLLLDLVPGKIIGKRTIRTQDITKRTLHEIFF